MGNDRVISIGFLTRRDLEVLGSEFTRHFPIIDDDAFADLLEKLDQIEVERVGDGVLLKPESRS